MWIRVKNSDQGPKPGTATRVVCLTALACMSFAQVGAIVLHIADASRELADLPWRAQGAERAPLKLALAEMSTGHVDLAAVGMGKQVGGVRYLGEGKPRAVVFVDVSSGACGTCT